MKPDRGSRTDSRQRRLGQRLGPFTYNIPAGTTSIDIVHDKRTRDVHVTVYEMRAPYPQRIIGGNISSIHHVDADTIKITFSGPISFAHRAVISDI